MDVDTSMPIVAKAASYAVQNSILSSCFPDVIVSDGKGQPPEFEATKLARALRAETTSPSVPSE